MSMNDAFLASKASRMKELMPGSKQLLGSAALGAALLLALTVGAAAQDSSSPRDKLAVWAGHWKIHAVTKETQFGHAKMADYDTTCSFVSYGAFMVCDALSLQPDDKGRMTDDLSVFYYNDLEKAFKHKGVGPEEEGGVLDGVVLVDGNTWTRPLEFPSKNGGGVSARFVYTLSADKRLCRFEISTDKGAHWTLVTDFVGTKES
jgi:hypothetical protein